eukprot:ctg_652.g424
MGCSTQHNECGESACGRCRDGAAAAGVDVGRGIRAGAPVSARCIAGGVGVRDRHPRGVPRTDHHRRRCRTEPAASPGAAGCGVRRGRPTRTTYDFAAIADGHARGAIDL